MKDSTEVEDSAPPSLSERTELISETTEKAEPKKQVIYGLCN